MVRSLMAKNHLPHYSSALVPVARMLRKQVTEAERKLWSFLRMKQLGVKFRRQVPFGPYVLDFFCAKAKLAVELDGGQHYTMMGNRKDIARDHYLREIGLEVLRYSGVEFLQNQDAVLEDVFDRVKDRTRRS
jgi:very-short-patch-repair endonuclease